MKTLTKYWAQQSNFSTIFKGKLGKGHTNLYSAPSIGPSVIKNLKKNKGIGVKMNMKMMMHSECDPEHYKKNIHINFK